MDPAPVAIALAMGLVAQALGLPPLLGFLAAGFIINAFGLIPGEMIGLLSQMGVTLLLFTIGLKLDVRQLLRPQIWGVASLHMLSISIAFGCLIYGLAVAQVGPFAELDFEASLIVAFALSFSSTVFAVKVLEDRGGTHSLQAQISIGILIMQDLIAVIFLVFAAGKVPSVLGIALIAGVIVFRHLLVKLMNACGHGELLVLFGMLLAIGGAQIFEKVGVKGDFGALLLGVLLAGHAKAIEMSKVLLRFKDLFLVGFFIQIGASASFEVEAVLLACFFTLLMPLKSVLYFVLFTRMKLSARTAFKSTLLLSNYSEFGLIVGGIAVANGWLSGDWLIAIAIALAITFIIASPINTRTPDLLARYRDRLLPFEGPHRLPEEKPIDVGDARAVILGMGRMGTGAYEKLHERYGDKVVGVDADPAVVKKHQREGHKVLHGDVTDALFWERIRSGGSVEVAMLAISNHEANMGAVRQRERIARLAGSKTITVVAAAGFTDEAQELKEAGADMVIDLHSDTGTLLAETLMDHLATAK